jgi:hypothetical protein
MDNSFISSTNINNIYEYINADMVKKHNINLDSDPKNKKLVKKLTKTVYDKINNDLMVSNSPAKIAVNNFNDMVINKCVPFLLNKANVKNTTNIPDKRKSKKYSVKKNYGVKKMVLEPTFDLTSSQKLDSGFQQYISDAGEFEQLVKESNQQINDSFKAYSEKESVFNSRENIENCSDDSKSEFTINRCALKDDVTNAKLDSTVFDNAFSEALLNDVNKPKPNPSGAESATNSKIGSYDNYDQINVRDLLSQVLVNQKDHSSNQLSSYEGELYLPNLIKEVGEEAPIQPLLYQNTTQGTERLSIKNLVIDSGDRGTTVTDDTGLLDLTAQGSPKAVTNLGTNNWYKLRVNLQETFKIDKLTDIYVKNFTLIGATQNINALYFSLGIEEFNIIKPSNNKYLKDKLIFRNTNTTDSANQVVSYSFPSQSYYVATTNPTTFYNLTLELTNDNNGHADDGVNKTFKTVSPTDANGDKNRFIIEFEFIPRVKQNDIIFDRTPYGSALNAELSNT